MKTLFSFHRAAAALLLWALAASASAQSVTITAPGNGATYTLGSTINLTATKTGATITKVRFSQNGNVISTDNTSPYTASFTPGTSGSYALVAEGLNASNTVLATSATVNVTVSGGTVTATRSYVYDSYGRLCKVIEPERGATVIEYDAASNIVWTAEGTNLTSTTDCQRTSVTAGQKVSRTYDAMNRVTAVSTPGGTADVTTTYYADGLVNTLTAANPGGNNVTTTYTYNKRRMLTGETSTNGATSVFALGYGYNNNGHLGALTYPDGKIVSYAPDALGRTTAVTDSDGRTYASAISYFPNGAIQQFTYGNGIVHTMTKNARQLPSRSQDLDGSTKILDDTYAFDANGNVDYVTDALPATATNRTRDLGYDALDRLIVADAVNQWGTATFSYDALDNIRSADVGTRQYRYNYDANNLLLNIKNPAGVQQFAFTYDARGNTLTKTGQAFAFDYGNRLNEVTGSQVYRYDGQGRRVQTTDVADGKTTFWIYSQSGQVLYTSEARRNQNVSYIYLGNTQVATKTVAWSPVNTTTISYQHTDSLGSIVAETNASKVVTKRNSYEPYGGAYNSTIDGTGYTGHVMDQGTGLTYMQQRYYDPQIGRFLSADPMPSDMNNAWNFNRYNYASNNPYRFVDPDGRASDSSEGKTENKDCDQACQDAKKKALEEKKKKRQERERETRSDMYFKHTITVNYYGGGSGHIGVSIDGGPSVGYYGGGNTASGFLAGQEGQGYMLDDSYQQGVDPTDSYTIEISADQAMKALSLVEKIRSNPGSYNLYSRNCTTVAQDILKAAGHPVKGDKAIAPDALIFRLRYDPDKLDALAPLYMP